MFRPLTDAHFHSIKTDTNCRQGVKALISVGGWTGSRFFSSAVASPENRTAFTKTLVDFANKFELDGLDFE